MAKVFEVAFRISGELASSLAAAMKAAQASMRGISKTSMQAAQNSMKAWQQSFAATNSALKNSDLYSQRQALTRISDLAANYKPMQSEIARTALATNAAAQKTNALTSAYENQRAKTKQLENELAALRQKSAQQRNEYRSQQVQARQLREQLRELQKLYSSQKSTLSAAQSNALKSQIQSTAAALNTLRESMNQSRQAGRDFSAQIKQTTQALREQKRAETESGRELTQSQKNLQSLRASLQSQLAALQSSRHALSQAGFSASNFAQQQARLRAELESTTRALERQQRFLNNQQAMSAATQNLSNSWNSFQASMQTAESFVNPFKSSIDSAMEFEYAMSKVKALTQMKNIRAGDFARVNQEMSEMTSNIKELGATTEFTMTEVAGAAGFYGMAGWDSTRITAALKQTVDLATIAGDHNIERTADVLSDDMTAMGLKAGEQMTLMNGQVVESASYFADAFAYALTSANVNRESLHEALKYNAPIAHQWGLTTGETFAMNMISANAGIKGTMAGTALRAGLLRTAAPPKKAAQAMQEMGLSASDAQRELAESQAAMQAYGVQVGDFETTLLSLSKVFNELDKSERLGFTDAVFGKNAASFWADILEKGQVADVIKAAHMIDSGEVVGYAQETAAIMRDNTKTEVEYLNSAIDALKTNIGDALLPAVRSTAAAISPLVSEFAIWVEQNPQVVQGAAAIAATLATVTIAAAGVQLAFAGWQFVTAGLTLAGDAVAIFASKAVAMSGTVISAMNSARLAMSGFIATAQTQGVLSALGGAFKGIGAAIAGAFGPALAIVAALALAGYFVYQNWDKVAPVFEHIGSTIQNAFSGVDDNLSPSLNNLLESLQRLAPVAEALGGVIFAALAVVGNAIVNTIVAAVNISASALKAIIDLVSGIGNVIASALAGDWSAAWEHMKTLAVNVITDIKDTILNIFTGVFDILSDLWTPVKTLMNKPAPNYSTVEQIQSANYVTPTPVQTSNYSTVEQIPTSNYSTVEQIQQVDTSQAQSQINQLGEAAAQSAATVQQNATVNDTVTQQAAQIVQTTSEASQQISTVVQNATSATEQIQQSAQVTTESNLQVQQSYSEVTSAIQLSTQATQQNATELSTHTTNLTSNSAVLQQHTSALQTSAAGLAEFNAALMSTNGGLTSLASSSSSAASSISMLGSAAQSAVSTMQSAASSIASAAASAAAKPAQNYAGGIYNKGAFLTWFAEKSPEAAIPLDKSARAINLWQQAGQMLGVLPGNVVNFDSPQTSTTATEFNNFQRQLNSKAQSVYSVAKNYFDNKKYSNFATKFDSLGNVVNYGGNVENLITSNDDIQVARAKQQAQLQYIKQISNAGDVISNYVDNLKSTAQNRNLISSYAANLKSTANFSNVISSSEVQNANSNFKISKQQAQASVENTSIIESGIAKISEILRFAFTSSSQKNQQNFTSVGGDFNSTGGDRLHLLQRLTSTFPKINLPNITPTFPTSPKLNFPTVGTPTFPTSPKLNFPTVGTPTFPIQQTQNHPVAMTAGNVNVLSQLKSWIMNQTGGDFIQPLKEITSATNFTNTTSTQSAPVTVNLNITVNGNSDAHETAAVIGDSITKQLEEFFHERQRVSFG